VKSNARFTIHNTKCLKIIARRKRYIRYKNNLYTGLEEGVELMARKIEIGTVLTGQDAIDFIEYMKNPTYTERANKMMQKIIRDYEEGKRI